MTTPPDETPPRPAGGDDGPEVQGPRGADLEGGPRQGAAQEGADRQVAARQRRRIVSSRHLADGPGWEASEFEFGMIVAFNAFSRWTVRCMAAAGHEMSPMEILVLHNVNHRGREKRLSDVCFLLNIEDTHTVNYALRKLREAGLITSEKRGKEMFHGTSDAGRALCDEYRRIRSQCLLPGLAHTDLSGEDLRRIAGALRTLSGQYDQASRAAASL